jgi:hypothetical protein
MQQRIADTKSGSNDGPDRDIPNKMVVRHHPQNHGGKRKDNWTHSELEQLGTAQPIEIESRNLIQHKKFWKNNFDQNWRLEIIYANFLSHLAVYPKIFVKVFFNGRRREGR